jgi:hypothetical protein
MLVLEEKNTNDVYRDMQCNIAEYDTSDYPYEHFLHNRSNAKVIGKFKDECNGEVLWSPLDNVVCCSLTIRKRRRRKGIEEDLREEQFPQC